MELTKFYTLSPAQKLLLNAAAAALDITTAAAARLLIEHPDGIVPGLTDSMANCWRFAKRKNTREAILALAGELIAADPGALPNPSTFDGLRLLLLENGSNPDTVTDDVLRCLAETGELIQCSAINPAALVCPPLRSIAARLSPGIAETAADANRARGLELLETFPGIRVCDVSLHAVEITGGRDAVFNAVQRLYQAGVRFEVSTVYVNNLHGRLIEFPRIII